MSPKAIPSVFTYQDEDSDVDVAIQFFDNKEEYFKNSQVDGAGNAPESHRGENL